MLLNGFIWLHFFFEKLILAIVIVLVLVVSILWWIDEQHYRVHRGRPQQLQQFDSDSKSQVSSERSEKCWQCRTM